MPALETSTTSEEAERVKTTVAPVEPSAQAAENPRSPLNRHERAKFSKHRTGLQIPGQLHVDEFPEVLNGIYIYRAECTGSKKSEVLVDEHGTKQRTATDKLATDQLRLLRLQAVTRLGFTHIAPPS